LIDLKLNSRPLHFVAAKGKAKAKTKTVNKVVLVDDSQFHRVQRQPRVNFTASRGSVELCAAFEKIPLDSGADFIDASLTSKMFESKTNRCLRELSTVFTSR
jgi:hypothetical protein